MGLHVIEESVLWSKFFSLINDISQKRERALTSMDLTPQWGWGDRYEPWFWIPKSSTEFGNLAHLMQKRSRQNDGLLEKFEVYSQRFGILFQLHERTEKTGIFDSASPLGMVKCIAKPGHIVGAFSCPHVFSGFNRCQCLFKRCLFKRC